MPAYVDQSRDALDPDKTVFEEISGGPDSSSSASARSHRRAYVARFNFKGADQQKCRRAVRRRAQPRPPGEAAAHAAATCCCSTNRPTTSTSIRCAPLEEALLRTSPAARWSSATTAGSSTASPRTSWRSKATASVVWFEGNYQDYEVQRHDGWARSRPTAPHQVQAASKNLTRSTKFE